MVHFVISVLSHLPEGRWLKSHFGHRMLYIMPFDIICIGLFIDNALLLGLLPYLRSERSQRIIFTTEEHRNRVAITAYMYLIRGI